MRVLMVTSEYPTPDRPYLGIFVHRQVEALQRAGVEVDVLNFWSRANPLNHFKAWQELTVRLRTQSYDVIHAQFGHTLPICVMQRRIPVVVTFRGDDLYGIIGKDNRYTLKGTLLVAISQFFSLFASQIMVVSKEMGQRLMFRRDYQVIPSGVDLDLFKPMSRTEARRELGWSQNGRIVLFAAMRSGDIHKRKRFDLAEAAVRQINTVFPVELKTAMDVLPQDMPVYMNAADALVFTSLHEGSPNVIKEALACNLPIVSVDVGDVRSRLEGVSASGIYDATPEALAEGLRLALEKPVRSNGRESVLELDNDVLAQRVIAIYQKAMDRHG
jgi:glycosyltransferase involved in cell wall biosynthesis